MENAFIFSKALDRFGENSLNEQAELKFVFQED